MTELIPFSKLENGFEKCHRNIEKLLKSSELLKTKYYSTSISLSILALEENAKLNFILKCINEKRGITKKEWENITGWGAHGRKLSMNIEEQEKKLKDWTMEDYLKDLEYSKNLGFDGSTTKSFEEIKRPRIDAKNKMMIFNEIKKDCFYLRWNDAEWFSVVTNMPEIIQKSLAYSLLEHVRNELIAIVIEFKYRDKSRSDPKVFEQFKNDPLLVEYRNRRTLANIREFKKKMSLSAEYLIKNYYLPKQKNAQRNNQTKDETS